MRTGDRRATAATTRRTTILLDAGLLDRLDRLSRTSGRTKTALIGEALAAFLDRAEPPRGPLAFIGIGRSGHGRLSLDASRIAAREMGGPPR